MYMFGFSSNLDPFRCQPDQNYLMTQPDPVEPLNWVQIWVQPKKSKIEYSGQWHIFEKKWNKLW